MGKMRFLALVLSAAFVLSLLPGATASASFDKDLLIDDTIFSNKNAMSAAQINAFLNARSFSCISEENGFEAKEPVGYNPDDGFLYGDYVSAGEVIYAAAQAYDLNPRVLIATLQKEQSLASASSSYCLNGSEHKYAAAMGYGCPDSGSSYSYTGISLYRRNGTVHSKTGTTCVNSARKAGFSQQIIYAAWLLKFGQQRSQGNTDWAIIRGNWDNSDDLESCYSGPMTRGNHQVCPSGSTVFYDGYRTIDGVKTYMGTGATAALYWYTPHFHGNENFVEIYESWFGPTKGTPLFRVGDTAPVYILGANNDYYHITSQAVLKAYGYGNTVSGVKKVSAGFLDGKTFSGTLPYLARFEGPEIYMISKGRAHHFTSQAMLNTYGFVIGDEARLQASAKAYYLDAEVIQPTVKNDDGPQVYSVEDGKKRHIINGEAYLSGDPSYASRPKVQLAETVLGTISNGAPILTADKLLKRTDKGSYVYWDGAKRQNVSKRVVLESALAPNYAALGSIIDQLPTDGTTIDKYAKTTGGSLWLLDSKLRYLVSPDDLDEMNLTTNSFTEAPDNFFGEIPTTKTFRRIFRINNGGAIYLLRDGKREHFTSRDAVTQNGFSLSQAINLNSTSGSLFPDSGKKILAFGTLFKIGSGDKIYVVNSTSTSLHIASRAIMDDFGFKFSDVLTLSGTQASNYPESGQLRNFVKGGSTNAWQIQFGKERHLVPASMQAAGAYDIDFSSLPAVDSSLIRRYSSEGDITDLIKAPDSGRVYKIENGTKRWITSKAAFISGGFSSDDITVVSSGFLKSIPGGANIN